MKRARIVGRDSVPSVIRSLRTEATRAPEVFGGSCLQRSALRLDLFSLSCPRLEVLPDRRLAIVDPVRSTCTLAAPGYMQGTHHLAQRHVWRASVIGRRGTRGSEGTECFRVETGCRENRFGNAQERRGAEHRWRLAGPLFLEAAAPAAGPRGIASRTRRLTGATPIRTAAASLRWRRSRRSGNRRTTRSATKSPCSGNRPH